MIKISPNEFAILSKYILDISGIAVDKGKEYLIETRLRPLLEELKLNSYTDLYMKSKQDRTKNIEKKIISAISTNETYFFRDKSPFQLLQHKLLPDIIDKKTQGLKNSLPVTIKIWSAANSTGQELYSIAMIIKELYLDSRKFHINLLGTDISNEAIAKASYGQYNKFEVARGLTTAQINKYFNKVGDNWRIKDDIRAMAVFKHMNLMNSFIGFGKFDIIFCRNVAIYFNPQTRKLLYKKIASVLNPDGALFIGSTESLNNDTDLFEPKRYLNATFYQFKKTK